MEKTKGVESLIANMMYETTSEGGMSQIQLLYFNPQVNELVIYFDGLDLHIQYSIHVVV